jgi:hypothetical protein
MDAIIGLPILLALCGALSFIWFKIFQLAGFESEKPILMALGMLLPIVNLVILIHFIVTPWPIQIELESLRKRLGIPAKSKSVSSNESSTQKMYFIMRENRVFGPYSVEQFLELDTNGKILPETPISLSADGPWKLAEELRAEAKPI